MTLHPKSLSMSLWAKPPTLPYPCMATVAPLRSSPIFFAASLTVKTSPLDVASGLPREPPISGGLPVTTPGTAKPSAMLIVSMIQAISRPLVLTSGAGMSFSGPMMIDISEAYLLVILSISPTDIVFGLTIMPPFAPPYGTSTTAVFQVIQAARARTSSMSTCWWYRIPPLYGPRDSLCWILYPVNTLIEPSSIRTGKLTVSSLFGLFNTSIIPESSPSFLPTTSTCFFMFSNGFAFSHAILTPLASPVCGHQQQPFDRSMREHVGHRFKACSITMRHFRKRLDGRGGFWQDIRKASVRKRSVFRALSQVLRKNFR